ncbi:Virulence regulon transcriptional activator VirF [compost metagenome]
MSEMASVFCMSEKSLARLGYIAFGTTIHEYVLKLRMAHSMKLLLFTDKPVNEVARLAGYSDPFFFSKTFKKQFGLSPSEIYRPVLNDVNKKSNGKYGQNKCD